MGKTKQILTKVENQLTQLIIILESDLKNEDRDVFCEFKEDIDKLYDLLRKINNRKEQK